MPYKSTTYSAWDVEYTGANSGPKPSIKYQCVPAGLGFATILPDLDFETFSAAGFVWSREDGKWVGPPRASQGKKGLPVVGAANYAKHPSAEILLMAYDLKDGLGRRRWRKGDPPPLDLFSHVQAGRLLEAWNVGFEQWLWEEVCVLRMGWPPMRNEQWRCAAAKARSFCLPGKLAEAGMVLNLDVQKDKVGTRLINRFTMPRNPTQSDPRLRATMLWSEADLEAELAAMVSAGAKPGPARKLLTADLADSALFADYNETDIVAEAGASARTPDMTPTELAYWQDDRAINRRGIAVDVPALQACADIVEQALVRYNAELHLLTGVDAASKIKHLTEWLHGQGVHMESLDEDAVTGALARRKLRTIIAGSRTISDAREVDAAVSSAWWDVSEVVCGGAQGPDLAGRHWADARAVPVKEKPADWNGPAGRGAGYARNIEMAEYAGALIAVWDGTSRGTAHMIEQAIQRGLAVLVWAPGQGVVRRHGGGLTTAARRALEIRQAVGSASVKKVFAMLNVVTAEGRIHDLYTWHGARTGRPTSQGPQAANLPKAGPPVVKCGACGHHHRPDAAVCPWCSFPAPPGRKPLEWNPEAAEDAIQVIQTRQLALVEHVMGDAMAAVAGALRGMYVASPGHDLVSSDFTAIEGVVIACLAGETWRIKAFHEDRSLYIESASRAFNIPLEEFEQHREATGQHHPMRQIGKGMELGLGFGGWINSLRAFDVEGTDDELKRYCLAWRSASPAITYFWGGQKIRRDLYEAACAASGETPEWWPDEQMRWGRPLLYGLEGAIIAAIQAPGTEMHVERLDGQQTGISYICKDDVLYLRLLSGRTIPYHRPRLTQSEQAWRGLRVTYEGHNSNAKKGAVGWFRMDLYGGLAAENVTQATARDIQMHAIRNLEATGAYPIVMHTYDEVVAEVLEGAGSVADLEARMTDVPSWARGWPIKAAGGWRAKRYRKG